MHRQRKFFAFGIVSRFSFYDNILAKSCLYYDFSSTEQATFAAMVRFEQSIVNQDDFQAELARDAAKVIARLPI
jgi:hypothetical protein